MNHSFFTLQFELFSFNSLSITDTMQVAVKAQDGSSFFVEIATKTTKDLFTNISSYMQLQISEFEEKHKLVHQGRLLNLNNPLPPSFVDGSSVVLLNRRKFQPLVYEDDPEPIEKQIESRMKQYALPPTEIPLDPEYVNLLMDMGFSEGRVRKALILCASDTEAALNWLLSNANDPTADEPLTQQQLREIVKRQQAFKPDPKIAQNLIEMGFAREEVEQALRVTHNSFEGACAWLTGERDIAGYREVADEAQGIAQVISDPRILAIMREIGENPQALQQYLNDPEFGPVLVEIIRRVRGQNP